MLLEQLTAEQFNGWRNYYQSEPWGEERADARSLYLSNRINAAWGGNLPYVERLDFQACVIEQYQDDPPSVEEIQAVMSEIERQRALEGK